MRSQHVGFFFTALLAVVAFIGNQLNDHRVDDEGLVVLASFLLVAFQLTTAFVFVVVCRLNVVHKGYMDAIKKGRNNLLADTRSSHAASALLESVGDKQGRVSDASRAILHWTLVAVPILLALLTLNFCFASDFDIGAAVIGALSCLAASIIYCYFNNYVDVKKASAKAEEDESKAGQG